MSLIKGTYREISPLSGKNISVETKSRLKYFLPRDGDISRYVPFIRDILTLYPIYTPDIKNRKKSLHKREILSLCSANISLYYIKGTY